MPDCKKLYDKDGVQFYPETKAEHVISNALGSLSTVSADLAFINNRVTNALKDLTGGSEIEGNLSVTKKFCLSAYSTEGDMLREVGEVADGDWTNNFELPSNEQPYAWIALRFSWKDVPLTPIYIITAIAAFDRTQTMYTSIGDLSGEGSLGGPTGYNTTTEVADKNYPEIKWSYYFPGISAGSPYGYIAVRFIPAGTRESEA
jgi:hypothetical protein